MPRMTPVCQECNSDGFVVIEVPTRLTTEPAWHAPHYLPRRIPCPACTGGAGDLKWDGEQ